MRTHYFTHAGKRYGSAKAPSDYAPSALARLTQQKGVCEVSEQEYQDWNHSECQSACVRRGAEKCVW